MKKTGFAILMTACAVICGCGHKEETGKPPVQEPKPPEVHTAEQYRDLLEKRVHSANGADINVMKEVSTYKNSSDEIKLRLYKTAESFLKK